MRSHLAATIKLTAFLCLLLLSPTLSAKTPDWRPITPEELAQKTPMVEKDADAEYLFWEVRVDNGDGDKLEMWHYVRVKIFTDRGRESFAKIDIEPSPYSKIKDLAARVIRPDGSILEIKKNDIFERTIVKVGDAKIKANSFAVPEIGVGLIVEYRYREVFPGGLADLDLHFQTDFPAQSITYYVRPDMHFFKMQYKRFNMPDGVDFVPEKKDFHSITMNNVPALHKEPMMPPVNEVRPWVMLYYTAPDSGGPDYWIRFGMKKANALIKLTAPDDDVKRVAAEVTNGAATPEEKLNRLFDYCQTKIKNLTYDTVMKDEEKEAIPVSASPAETIKRQMGWHVDIDELFIALVGAAGLTPRLAYSGDRSRMFFTPKLNLSGMINFSGIAVQIGTKWMYFDPGERFLPAGMLEWTAEGQDTLLVDTQGILWTRSPTSPPEQSQEKRTGKFRLLDDGTLEGEVTLEYTGHLADWRKSANYDDTPAKQEEALRDELKQRLATAEVTEVKVEHANEPKVPFIYRFKIKVPGYAQRTGKRLLLQPSFFEHGVEAVFTATERRFEIYFHYPWSEDDSITIDLPAGFTVENAETPPPIKPEMTAGSSGQTIRMGLSKDQKAIVFHRDYFFGGGGNILFPKSSYPGLKSLFEQVHLADTQTIVLRQN